MRNTLISFTRVAALVVGPVVLLAGAWACGGESKPAVSPDGDPSVYESRSSGGNSGPASTSTSNLGNIQEHGDLKHNTYDKENTEVVLRRAARQVKDNCGAAKDENGVALGPWGKLRIHVTLGHGGRSKLGTVPVPYADKPVGRCIAQAFSNLIFPPWAGEDTDVEWEVELQKPEVSAEKPQK